MLWQIRSSPPAPADQGDQEKDDKDKKQDLGYRSGAGRNPEETKSTCHQGYDKENQCPA
jgi:hypothetical protein